MNADPTRVLIFDADTRHNRGARPAANRSRRPRVGADSRRETDTLVFRVLERMTPALAVLFLLSACEGYFLAAQVNSVSGLSYLLLWVGLRNRIVTVGWARSAGALAVGVVLLNVLPYSHGSAVFCPATPIVFIVIGLGIFPRRQSLETTARLELANELREALKGDELFLEYQPILSLKEGGITGCEALLRWRKKSGEVVPAGQFIGLAEESGLIDDIGWWVLRRACEQNAAWQKAGLRPVKVAVNVSTCQLRRGDFVARTAEILERSGLAPEWLELELTESAALDRDNVAVEALQELSATGVSLSLDDFGTGYSSLNRLKLIPFSRLKINASFLVGLPLEGKGAALVQAIVRLARDMNLEVVAEGVETVEQLAFLADRRCDLIQGHIISRSISGDRFALHLRSGMRPKVCGRETRMDAPVSAMKRALGAAGMTDMFRFQEFAPDGGEVSRGSKSLGLYRLLQHKGPAGRVPKELTRRYDLQLDADPDPSATPAYEADGPLTLSRMAAMVSAAGRELSAVPRRKAADVSATALVNGRLVATHSVRGRGTEWAGANFNLHRLVGEVGCMVDGAARTQGAQLLLTVDSDVPALLRGDTNVIRQVFFEMTSLVIRCVGLGTVAIRVGGERGAGDEMRIRFSVKGAATTRGQQDEAARGGETAFSGENAVGRALDACKHLLGRVGGEFGAEEHPGEAALFWFTICCRKRGQDLSEALRGDAVA